MARLAANCTLRLAAATSFLLVGAAGNRRHQQDLIAVLKGVRSAAQKAYVFLIHINIEKAPYFSRLIAQMRLQVGKFQVESGKQLSKVRSFTSQVRRARREPPQRSWNLNGNAHNVRLQNEFV